MHAHGQGVRWLDLSARGAVLCWPLVCAGSQHGVLAVAVEPAGRAAVRRRGPLPAAAARGVACTDGALGRRDRHAADVGAGGDSCGLRAIGLSPSRGAALCAESKSIAQPCRAVYQIRSLVTKRNRPLASALTGELARQAKSYCGFFVQRGERRDLDLRDPFNAAARIFDRPLEIAVLGLPSLRVLERLVPGYTAVPSRYPE